MKPSTPPAIDRRELGASISPPGYPSSPTVHELGRRGLTVVEMVLVLAIAGTLAGLAAPKYQDALDQAKVAKAIGDIEAMEVDIMGYEASYGAPPETLGGIGRPGFLDPWGNPYRYLSFVTVADGPDGKRKVVSKPAVKPRKDRFLKPLNSSYDLYSMGKDGESADDLQANESADDVVRANDGVYVGLASRY